MNDLNDGENGNKSMIHS